MSSADAKKGGTGPFRASDLKPGDRYELTDGHPVFCAPTGGDGARRMGLAFEVLDSDPAVDSAGVDAGYSPEPGMLRAPDVSVGNVPDARGWIAGVPPLAVEYAGSGQDEGELQAKIADLLRLGTRHIWVVRLLGPRRVEVYSPGAAPQTRSSGEQLLAPGILRNAVPVDALYDRDVAHELVLSNLLQRRGVQSLEQLREQGREQGLEQGREQGLEQGREQGLRVAVRDLCEALGIDWTAEREAHVEQLDAAGLDSLRDELKRNRAFPRASN